MVTMEQAWLLPAVPALAFVILALCQFLRIPLPRQGDWIGVAAAIASYILMLMVAGDLFDQLPHFAGELTGNKSGFDWIEIPALDFALRVDFHVDQITVVMLIVVGFLDRALSENVSAGSVLTQAVSLTAVITAGLITLAIAARALQIEEFVTVAAMVRSRVQKLRRRHGDRKAT